MWGREMHSFKRVVRGITDSGLVERLYKSRDEMYVVEVRVVDDGDGCHVTYV